MLSDLRPNVDHLLRARGMSKSDLSARVGRSVEDLDALLSDANQRRATLIRDVARELLVPDFLLSLERRPAVPESIVDFRKADPRPGAYALDTLKAIELARSVRNTAGSLKLSSGHALQELAGASEPSAAAQLLRKQLDLSIEQQLRATDARLFYAFVREKIERFRVFVLQLSFSDGAGFCLSEPSRTDTICVNTYNQNYTRRLFTLGHEVYHCVVSTTGLSDPDLTINSLESACETFAAEFIAPADLVRLAAARTISSKSFQLDELASFSRLTKLSLHASVRRLADLSYYSDDAKRHWYAFLSEHRNPDFNPPKGGGRGRAEEWKYKLSRFGFRFPRVFGTAAKSGLLDEVDIFRMSGLKPKWQSSFFDKASSARAEDVEDE